MNTLFFLYIIRGRPSLYSAFRPYQPPGSTLRPRASPLHR